jgi:solute carrier family 25 (mitochondrial phosphate transporter), member 3
MSTCSDITKHPTLSPLTHCTMKKPRSILLVFLAPLLLLVTTAPVVESSAAATEVVNAALKKTFDYRYFVAGGTCAAISHGITTPIDVIKTRKQSDPVKYNKNSGLLATARAIVTTEGAGALLGGLGPTVVGYGVEGAMKFGVYEVMKPIFAGMFPSSESKAIPYLLASVVAGAVAAVLLCPMESMRIRIVTDPAYAAQGLLSALPKMVREVGVFHSFFAGLAAMLAKQIPYTLGKQVSFDVFAGMLYAFFHSVRDTMTATLQPTDVQIKWAVSITAAFLASIIACIFSQPGDMILTETHKPKKQTKGAAVSEDHRSFADVIHTIYKAGGLPAFFTGTGARIVHVGLIITSQLVIYDVVKQLLGLPATGSH